jgi:type IV secretion system protein VirB11
MNVENMERKTEFLKKMLGEVICSAFEDDDITEIMLNPDGLIWLESRTNGKFQKGSLSVFNARSFLNQVASLSNLFLNEKEPILETKISYFNNARIEAEIPPLVENPSFTIRKPPKHVYELETYVEQEILKKKHFEFICEALKKRSNILVVGDPGSGKTTFTNACIAKIRQVDDINQRILILEDTSELQCEMPNKVNLLTSKYVDMNGLLRVAMRSRPDRILVGEVRDKAALDMLKCWNTGCPGGIATTHANSTEAAILRILSLAQEANVPPPISLVAETIHVIVNIVSDPTHPKKRVVRQVSELSGFDGNNFKFNHIGD